MKPLDDLELESDDDGEPEAGRELGDPSEPLGEPGGPSELEASDSAELPLDVAPERPLIPPVVPALLLLVAVPLGLYVWLRPAAPPEGTPETSATPLGLAPAPTAEPAPAADESPPDVALPSLEASDAAVRELLAAASPHPGLAAWLGREQLVRTFVVVVANVADGDSPAPHLDFLAPEGEFRTRDAGAAPVMDRSGYRRFDATAAVLASVDAAEAARVLRLLGPLLEEAYKELGHPQGGFDAALKRAIDKLLAVPVPRGDVELRRLSANYAFADPALEALEPAQKMLLRAGPDNQRAIQQRLREVAERLEPAAATPRSP